MSDFTKTAQVSPVECLILDALRRMGEHGQLIIKKQAGHISDILVVNKLDRDEIKAAQGVKVIKFSA